MASNALRVLGVAYRPLAEVPDKSACRGDREGSHLRRPARHDRSGAAGSRGAIKVAERRRTAAASWSPATTRTPPRRSPGEIGLLTAGRPRAHRAGDREADRRGTGGQDRQAAGVLPGFAAAQDAHRRCAESARPRRRDDGRRRERRAGAEARQHRRRHGHHRHRRDQADRGHGPHRRQLRQHRRRDRAGPDHLLATSASSSTSCSPATPARS